MMPHICAIAATSIDGRIGRDSAHVTDWTSPEDKASLYSHLAACDAVVVGMYDKYIDQYAMNADYVRRYGSNTGIS